MMKNKDEYDEIYQAQLDLEEPCEREDPQDIVDRMKGSISSGDCIYCGAKNAMTYEGDICFICEKCGKSTHESIYYLWCAGYDVDLGE